MAANIANTGKTITARFHRAPVSRVVRHEVAAGDIIGWDKVMVVAPP